MYMDEMNQYWSGNHPWAMGGMDGGKGGDDYGNGGSAVNNMLHAASDWIMKEVPDAQKQGGMVEWGTLIKLIDYLKDSKF